MKYTKPSELLDDIDSHSIYDPEMLEECDFDTSSIPVESRGEVQRQIKARGLGGWVSEDLGDSFTGHKAAFALAMKYLGKDPAPGIQGRGTHFRACRDALKEAGY